MNDVEMERFREPKRCPECGEETHIIKCVHVMTGKWNLKVECHNCMMTLKTIYQDDVNGGG